MKSKIIIFTLLILCLTLPTFATTTVPDGAREAAVAGLENYKYKNIDIYYDFGYSSKEEFENANIGEGFRIHHVNYPAIDYNKKNSFKETIGATNEWLFIVESDGRAVSYIKVKGDHLHYRESIFGGDSSYFAESLNLFKSQKKTEPILVAHGNQYFFVAEHPSEELVMPIPAPFMAKQGRKAEFYKSNQILIQLRKAQANYKPGQMGGTGFDFPETNELNSQPSPVNKFIPLAIGGILLGVLGIYHKRFI